jgi:competence protein ComEC
MYTFDVGQSESILLLYQGNSILIDSATVDYAYPLVQTLKKLGIKNLDYCIFTHPHYDHMGGSSAILRSFEPSKVYVTKYDYNSLKKWWFKVYQKTIAYTDTSPEILSKGDIIGINDLKLHVISPISNSYENLNDYSIGIKASLQDIDILLLGDSEASAEHDLIESEYLLESEILKVSHHGSTTSSTQEFLAKVLPDYAIMSVGKNNPYGHPKKSTLQKLSSIGAKIYRTDQNGTILIITDGKNTWTACSRNFARPNHVEDKPATHIDYVDFWAVGDAFDYHYYLDDISIKAGCSGVIGDHSINNATTAPIYVSDGNENHYKASSCVHSGLTPCTLVDGTCSVCGWKAE